MNYFNRSVPETKLQGPVSNPTSLFEHPYLSKEQVMAAVIARKELLKRKPKKPSKGQRVKPRRKERSRGLMERLGNTTLRDAADAVGSVVRGAAKAVAYFNTEVKMIDTTQAGVAVVQGTPNIQSLTLIAAGTGYNQREGLSILMQKLYVSLSVVANNAAAAGNFFRFIVVQDMQNQGSAPVATNILESTGADIYLSHYAHVLKDRFRVLLDEHIPVVYSSNCYYKRLEVDIENHCSFLSTGATNADQYEGSVWAMMVTDNATNGPTVAFDARITYVDN